MEKINSYSKRISIKNGDGSMKDIQDIKDLIFVNIFISVVFGCFVVSSALWINDLKHDVYKIEQTVNNVNFGKCRK